MRVDLSIVVPMKNEEELVEEFIQRCIAATREMGRVEIIVVDDGSTDSTLNRLKELAAIHLELRVVSLSRNFGHQAAQLAGLRYSMGDLVLFIDGDLQDPPELIPEMVKTIKTQEADVLSMRRTKRPGDRSFKRLTAYLYYRILNKLSDVEIPKDVGDFRLVTRKVADLVLSMEEHGQYLRGVVPWLGGKQILLDYEREARKSGETKFSLKHMFSFASDGIVAFSVVPLRLAFGVSVFSFVISIVSGAWALLASISGQTVSGWASLVFVVSLFSALTHAVLAIIGLYLGRVHQNLMRRPPFVVREIFSCNHLGDQHFPREDSDGRV